MDLNKMLSSCCRQRILKTLSKNQAASMMKLVKMTNSTYNEVDRNLNILEHERLVTQQRIGNKRIIQLNRENHETLLLLKILEILEHTHHSLETYSRPPKRPNCLHYNYSK